jgi:hypothetical protein
LFALSWPPGGVVVVVGVDDDELHADRSAAAARPTAASGTAFRPRRELSGFEFLMCVSPSIVVRADAARSTGRAATATRNIPRGSERLVNSS